MKVNWSELSVDVLRCVFERLSFTDLNRAKSVCSSWHSAWRGCRFKGNRNQIPWLILFPEANNNYYSSSCVFIVPDDRDQVYKTRDLGRDFVRSCCLATYGSWLLMMDVHYDLNILNPLTGERIDLPLTEYDNKNQDRWSSSSSSSSFLFDDMEQLEGMLCPSLACLWIDDRSKDYIVVWKMVGHLVFTKKGNNNNTWRRIPRTCYGGCQGEQQQLVYEHKAQKLYYLAGGVVKIWCFSFGDGDGNVDDPPPQQVFEDYYAPIEFCFWDFLSDRSKFGQEMYLKEEELYVKEYVDSRLNIAVSTTSGQVLKVASAVQKSKRWLFRVYKMHPIKLNWQVIDSLGDEALILDMGITVVAKDIPGIKRNSIYFSGLDYGRNNTDHIFVFDLTTHKIEPCVLSSIPFSDARWFFPGLTTG